MTPKTRFGKEEKIAKRILVGEHSLFTIKDVKVRKKAIQASGQVAKKD